MKTRRLWRKRIKEKEKKEKCCLCYDSENTVAPIITITRPIFEKNELYNEEIFAYLLLSVCSY